MASTRVFGLALSILMLSTTLTGCLGLAVQREFMESIRDEPKHPVKVVESMRIDNANPNARVDVINYSETDMFLQSTLYKSSMQASMTGY